MSEFEYVYFLYLSICLLALFSSFSINLKIQESTQDLSNLHGFNFQVSLTDHYVARCLNLSVSIKSENSIVEVKSLIFVSSVRWRCEAAVV